MIFSKILKGRFSFRATSQFAKPQSGSLNDREKLTRLLLEKHPFDSLPVQAILKRMNEQSPKDLYYYNKLLSIFVKTRQPTVHVENLLKEMKGAKIEPDNYTQHTLLFYFCINKSIDEAEILAQSIKELNSTGNWIILYYLGITSLVRGYAVCGRPEKAREWFNKAKERDIILYNAMLQTYIDSEIWGGVHEIFGMMLSDPKKLIPTIITYKTFFKALIRQEKFEEAKKLFYDSIAEHERLEFGQIKEILKWLSWVTKADESLLAFTDEVTKLAQRRFPEEFNDELLIPLPEEQLRRT